MKNNNNHIKSKTSKDNTNKEKKYPFQNDPIPTIQGRTTSIFELMKHGFGLGLGSSLARVSIDKIFQTNIPQNNPQNNINTNHLDNFISELDIYEKYIECKNNMFLPNYEITKECKNLFKKFEN